MWSWSTFQAPSNAVCLPHQSRRRKTRTKVHIQIRFFKISPNLSNLTKSCLHHLRKITLVLHTFPISKWTSLTDQQISLVGHLSPGPCLDLELGNTKVADFDPRHIRGASSRQRKERRKEIREESREFGNGGKNLHRPSK